MGLFIYSGVRRFLCIYVYPALSALQFIRIFKTHSAQICSYYEGLQYPQNIQLENLTNLISSYAFLIQSYSDPSLHIRVHDVRDTDVVVSPNQHTFEIWRGSFAG
jgi:hypothetical protein